MLKIKLNVPVKIEFINKCEYPFVDLMGEEPTEHYSKQKIGDTLEGCFTMNVSRGVYSFEFDNGDSLIEKLHLEDIIIHHGESRILTT